MYPTKDLDASRTYKEHHTFFFFNGQTFLTETSPNCKHWKDKFMRRCSTSLNIKVGQMNTTTSHHYMLTRMLEILKADYAK